MSWRKLLAQGPLDDTGQRSLIGLGNDQQYQPASRRFVINVDHEAVLNARNCLHHRIELSCPHPNSAAVEGGVGAATDDATPPWGDLDPVPVAPNAGVRIE